MANPYNDNQCIDINFTDSETQKSHDIRTGGTDGSAHEDGVYGGENGIDKIPLDKIKYMRELPCGPLDIKAFRTLFYRVFKLIEEQCQKIKNLCIDIPTTFEIQSSENVELTFGDVVFSPRTGNLTTGTSSVGNFQLQILGNDIEFTDLLGSPPQPVFRGEVVPTDNRQEQVQFTMPQVPSTLVIWFGSMNSSTGNYSGEQILNINPPPDSTQNIPQMGGSQGETNLQCTWNNLAGTTITFTVNTGTNVYGIWNAIGFRIELFSVKGTEKIQGFKRVCRNGDVTFIDKNGVEYPNAKEECCADA